MMRMMRQKVWFGALVLLLWVVVLPAAFAQSCPNPGHPASQIGGGTFNSNFGAFTFPQNLTVTNNISAAYCCLNGVCRNSWPSSSIDDCTDVNACTIIAEDTSCADDALLDGNGDCWAIDSTGDCDAGTVCGAGHTHSIYDNYVSWDFYVDGVYADVITSAEDVTFNASTGIDVNWDGSRDINFSFDCSDVAGTSLGCSGNELIGVTTNFEEEVHCTEHDGTGTSCSGETLNIDTIYQGADARCSGTQVYLDGEGNCDSGYLDADGVDSVDDAVNNCAAVNACEADPQVGVLVAGMRCRVNSTATGFDCDEDVVDDCSECDSTFINKLGDTTGAMTADLNLDANTFVISYDDNKVGIGTASPASTLSVGGAGNSNYEVSAYADTTNHVYLASADTGIYTRGTDYGAICGDVSYTTSYCTYGSGTVFGVVGDGSVGYYGIHAYGGSTGAVYGSESAGTAILSNGTTQLYYGGLCLDDTTACALDSAGDGDFVIMDGSVCVGNGGCNWNHTIDGWVMTEGSVRTYQDYTYGYIGFGSDGDTEIYYASAGTYYFYADDNALASIYVEGCSGCDIAEHASAAEDEVIEPGDIVVISEDSEYDLTRSAEPYSSNVAGVFSSTPGIFMDKPSLSRDVPENTSRGSMRIGGGSFDFEGFNGTEHNGTVPLALAGQVPVKVCLENGPIVKGDRITTSSFPGHGMRWLPVDLSGAQSLDELKALMLDNERRRGAVVGKALEGFDGTNSTYNNHLSQPCGKLRILLSLQ